MLSSAVTRIMAVSTKLASRAALTTLEGSFRSLSMSAPYARSIKDVWGKGVVRGDDATALGLTGGNSIMSVNTSDVDERMPTPLTMKQLFNGIPFDELPIVYIKSTRNNTIIHTYDTSNKAVMYTSCRIEGFKNAKKKTVIAGQTTGAAAGQKLLRRGIHTLQVRVAIKGIGPGRMSSVKGMVTSGVTVVSITDRTPMPELGPRPKKVRRI